jgi:hypothetical protein
MNPETPNLETGRGSPPGMPATEPSACPPAAADSAATRGRAFLGSALLFLGIGVLGLLLVDRTGLPFSMPRSWYIDRALWVAGGLIAVGVGWYLLRDPEADPAAAEGGTEPEFSAAGLGIPGRRFTRLVLYTRTGCHLCDEARATLNKYAVYLPPIVEVDIDDNPALVAQFSTCVPVVEFDGKVRFRGRVSELLLRRLIAATPPRDTTRSGQNL